MRKSTVFASTLLTPMSVSAIAAETLNCTDDANGRPTKVVCIGAMNNNVPVQYMYGNANSRKNMTAMGSLNPPLP